MYFIIKLIKFGLFNDVAFPFRPMMLAVVASLDKTLYEDYICLVASNK